MPARASHIPAYRERSILQMLHDRGELQTTQLQDTGVTINKLIAKGWIEARSPRAFRITAEGTTALKFKIPSST